VFKSSFAGDTPDSAFRRGFAKEKEMFFCFTIPVLVFTRLCTRLVTNLIGVLGMIPLEFGFFLHLICGDYHLVYRIVESVCLLGSPTIWEGSLCLVHVVQMAMCYDSFAWGESYER
jgi:hypothetical protein